MKLHEILGHQQLDEKLGGPDMAKIAKLTADRLMAEAKREMDMIGQEYSNKALIDRVYMLHSLMANDVWVELHKHARKLGVKAARTYKG